MKPILSLHKDVIARNTGKLVCTFMHGIVPHFVALTDNDLHYQPYLIEYPKSQMRDKIAFMTDLLENKLQTKNVKSPCWALGI